LALTANGGYAEALSVLGNKIRDVIAHGRCVAAAGESCFVPVPSGWSAIEAAPVQCTVRRRKKFIDFLEVNLK
jgi:hypothetical protein